MNTKMLKLGEEYKAPYGLRTIFTDDEFLRQKSVDVTTINDEVRILIENMTYVMEVYGGLGISAPQLGEHLKIFILNEPKITFINPSILRAFGGVDIKHEGCMSIPGMLVEVPRYRKITLHWYDIQGRGNQTTFSGMTARVIQHEIDHLNGLLIDRYEK